MHFLHHHQQRVEISTKFNTGDVVLAWLQYQKLLLCRLFSGPPE